MEVRSALTTEYVRIPVAASTAGVPINPTTDDVEIAVIPTGGTPVTGDWKTATWETDATTDPDTYYARVLIGPAPGVVTLTAGKIYDTWVRVHDNPEVVVVNAGYIGVL